MGHPSDSAFDDRLLASAVRFMIDGQEEDAANVLLSCRLDTLHKTYKSDYRTEYGDWDILSYSVLLECSRSAYDILNDPDNFTGKAVFNAIRAVAPLRPPMRKIILRGEFIEVDPAWRTELLEIARGRGIHNQLSEQTQAKCAYLEKPKISFAERGPNRHRT